MKLKLDIPKAIGKKLKPDVRGLVGSVEKEVFGIRYSMTVFVDPGKFRALCDLVSKSTRGKGTVQVLEMAVQNIADEQLL